MEITCAQCGFKADVPDTYKGKKLCCPQCRNAFVCGEDKSTFTLMDDPEEDAAAPASSKTTSGTSSTPAPSAPPINSETMALSSDTREVKISVASNAPKAEVPIAEYHCGNTQLSLTNRHLTGEVETLVESDRPGLSGKKTCLTRRENISVLLSNISSYTLTDDAAIVWRYTIALRVFATIFVLGILFAGIGLMIEEPNVGILVCICSFIPSLLYFVKYKIHYLLNIKVMGFEYKIPITNNSTKKCLDFLGKLKTAKMAFEESM